MACAKGERSERVGEEERRPPWTEERQGEPLLLAAGATREGVRTATTMHGGKHGNLSRCA